MQGRMGIYDKKPFNPNTAAVEGVEHQSVRFRQNGGNRQQERMIRDKRRSLDRAVWNSYQGAEITHVGEDKPVRALINPNKLKQDYDDKIVSVGFEHNFKTGDVFEWIGTKSHWLIYLQDLTELAYFRGDIRRCRYEISWEDENGKHTTYAAVRGPVETKINYIQKHGISVDTPNYSLSLLLPLNEATLEYFKRYQKFYLRTDHEAAQRVCWRVEAIDWISTPGILEVTGVEYYANETEDDIDNGIVGGLLVKEENPNPEEVEEAIVGETFIKPKIEYEYKFSGTLWTDWSIDSKMPVEYKVDENDYTVIRLKWLSPYSGQFTLNYGTYTKTIVVESLF